MKDNTIPIACMLQLLLKTLFLVASTPTQLRLVQDGPTSITVTWAPPSPLGNTTGFMIYYTGVGNSGSVDVSYRSNSHRLNGLQSGIYHEVFVVGLSRHLTSELIISFLLLGKLSITHN